jgi:hypothetical protein
LKIALITWLAIDGEEDKKRRFRAYFPRKGWAWH